MNTTVIKSVAMFAAGAATGSVATWLLLKKKYEKFAQEQIDSVKEVFSKREKEIVDIPEEAPKETQESEAYEDPEIAIYRDVLTGLGYTNRSKEDDKSMDAPYVIPPEEFGEFEDYRRYNLTYYADGVLADEDNELVDDVDDVVGLNSLNHIGDYEPDSVHVRNDRLRCDYEILLDHRNYSDVIKTPHPMEEE